MSQSRNIFLRVGRGAALPTGLGLLCLAMFALSACRKDEPREEKQDSSYDGAIHFSVSLDEGPETKFLVGNPAAGDDGRTGDFISLQKACDKADSESPHMGIGLWADYFIPSRPDIAPVKDIYKFETSNLQYDSNIKAEKGDEKYAWVFNTADNYKYWAIGGQYVFRAFYPFSKVASLVHKDSNGELFMINYSSKAVQEDILVACREINTYHNAQRYWGKQGVAVEDGTLADSDPSGVDPTYGWYKFDLSNPVALKFQHVLAAIRFKFEYSYESEGTLREFWFENVDKKGFCSEGTMSYGNSSTDAENPGNIHNFRWNVHQVDFHTDNEVTNRFYYWKYYVSGTNMKSEYKRGSDDKIIEPKELDIKTCAVPYTCTFTGTHDFSTGVTGGLSAAQAEAYHNLYTNHNGWLLVPPQEVEGKNVLMCFTTGVLTEPVETDLFSSIDIGTYVVKDAKGAFVAEGTAADVAGYGSEYTKSKCLLPGYRYEITVKLTPTNVQFGKITIEPWKKLLSSEEIIF